MVGPETQPHAECKNSRRCSSNFPAAAIASNGQIACSVVFSLFSCIVILKAFQYYNWLHEGSKLGGKLALPMLLC